MVLLRSELISKSGGINHGALIGVSKTVLEFSKLGLKSSLALAEGRDMVLLRSELISKSGGINHGLFGLLLRVLGLVQKVINLSLHGVESSLNTSLVSGSSGVDGVHLVDSSAGLTKLSLGLSLASISRVQQSSGLLHLSLEAVGASVSQAGLLGHLLTDSGGLLVLAFSLTELTLVSLDGLEGLVVGLVGVVQSNLVLIDVRVELLLDLSKLKLSPQDLVLLSLKSTLGLLKSSLELLLLGLEPPALFVKLVDGAASITKLVKEILDLISEVLVLAADNVQLLIGLIQGSLETESLSIEVAALRVAGIKLSHQVISLGLPLSNNLVKVAAALLGDHGSSVGPLILHRQLLQLVVHPRL